MTSSPSFTVRTEADVLALIPYTFGFVPQDSLVLVALSSPPGRAPFHARVDLPEDLGVLDEVAGQIARAAARNRAAAALVVAYTDDELLAALASDVLQERLECVGIETLMAIRADGHRWFRLDGTDHGPHLSGGVPYDLRSHALTMRAVYEGKVTYLNREALRDSLTAVDPDAVDEVERACADLPPLSSDDVEAVVAEGAWLVGLVAGCVIAEDAHRIDDEDLPRALRALAVAAVRDAVLALVDPATAIAHCRLWREVVRRSPSHRQADPAALLAFAAWQAGDGALAWCAVDLARESDPDHRLAAVVAQALEEAIPPSGWLATATDRLRPGGAPASDAPPQRRRSGRG